MEKDDGREDQRKFAGYDRKKIEREDTRKRRGGGGRRIASKDKEEGTTGKCLAKRVGR